MNSYIKKNKMPFHWINEFYTDTENRYLYYIKNKEIIYSIDLSDLSFRPKSGLMLTKHLERICQGKDVLDYGTGPSMILAQHAKALGANRVVAVDIDPSVLHYICDHAEGIEVGHVSMLNEFRNSFDIIVTNPPQMPNLKQLHNYHDVGGAHGEETILEIIDSGYGLLRNNGVLLLLVFGFIGVESRTSPNTPSVYEYIKDRYDVDEVQKYIVPIRSNGAIYKSVSDIEKIYPLYKFIKREDEIFNEIYILSLRKVVK